MNEAKLTRDIIVALNMIPGVWVWRRNVGRRGHVQFGKPGMADIEGVLRPHGRRIELEVKIDAAVTALQSRWIDDIRGYGGAAAIVHSVSEAIDFVEATIRGA